MIRSTSSSRRGFAILTVLLVLMALFVMVAPFLLTARNADAASARLADRASARLALDSAARHARARLRASHPALDSTPYFDSADELEVSTDFPSDLLRSDDPNGVMWDLEVRDVSGLIDLNSAPPQLIANLGGLVTRTSRPVAAEDAELSATGTSAFPDAGFLWVAGERIAYTGRDARAFTDLSRGLLAETDSEGNGAQCGPSVPRDIAAGRPVFEQRAWALAEWRVARGGEEPAHLDGFDQLDEVADFAMGRELGPELAAALREHGTLWGGERAGATWQRATRVRNDLERGVDCELAVDDARWFNPGTTVQIRSAGVAELGLVLESRDGRIKLTEPVRNDIRAYEADVRPLARRPVNVNTASTVVLSALFENLKLRGVNQRITASEAGALAAVVVESRPFVGFEDFVERIVFPAGAIEALPDDAPLVPEAFVGDGAGLVDAEDAAALYLNALNANDRQLEFSTMPLAFTSRDVYALELRGAVNAKSGAHRLGIVRDDVELVVPQEPLMQLWTRQEDFDLALRLERDAPHWLTGPEPTSQYAADFSTPASRYAAHFGVEDPETGERVKSFASREDDGWIKLEPSRIDESADARLRGRVLHFDREDTDPEGRDLAQAPVVLDTASDKVQWTVDGGLVEPFTFSAWIKPLGALADGELLFDLGSNLPAPLESDRVELVAEDGDLVLRVLDAAGDHPSTNFREAGEVRYPMTGDGPGLPADTWTHVSLDVRGNRPSQMTMIVDGRMATETPGITRLTQSVGDADTTIRVESTAGFPQQCVLRIGDEIIEAKVTSDTSFDATANVDAPGRGGRLARERVIYPSQDEDAYEPEALDGTRAKETQHPLGAAVELYGYSMPLAGVVSDASDGLPTALGPFRVGRVGDATVGGGGLEDIEINDPTVDPQDSTPKIGEGFRSDALESLTIWPADQTIEGTASKRAEWVAENVMPAFDPNGGYAAIVSRPLNFVNSGYLTAQGEPIGGIEIIEYSGWRHTGEAVVVDVAARALKPPLGAASASGEAFPVVARDDGYQKVNLDADPPIGQRVAFVLRFEDIEEASTGLNITDQLNSRRTNQVFIIPISVPGGGGLLPEQYPAFHSEVAQIAGNEAETTEWVRYDEYAPKYGHLVRSDPRYLRLARAAAVGEIYELGVDPAPDLTGLTANVDPPDITPDPGGPNPGPDGQPGGIIDTPPGGPPPLPAGQGVGTAYWSPLLGTSENGADFPISHAVESALQFRGVLGTYSHAHPAGTAVTPVLRAWPTPSADSESYAVPYGESVEDYGWPGRLDNAFLVSDLDGAAVLGEPVTLWHVHRPQQYLQYEWDDLSEDGELVLGTETHTIDHIDADLFNRYVWFSLRGASQAPLMTETIDPPLDQRLRTRLVKFPSGELPRTANRVVLGGQFDAPGQLAPSALIDEAVFGEVLLGGADPTEPATRGGSFILEVALGEGGNQPIQVVPATVRGATRLGLANALNSLPTDGGLLRIGDEILAYLTVDPSVGIILPQTGGRGLLGTTTQPHQPGESVTWLESWPTTVLAADVLPESSALPVVSTTRFPFRGTVRIDDELVHYTHIRGGALGMPKASEVPGARDGKGPGLFRGRYGTTADAHAGGTAVILYPFRYWDLWAERADAPELAYFGFELAQPGAFWSSVFWQEEEAVHAGPRLAVLQRTDPRTPWDADPTTDDDLALIERGMPQDAGNPIARQADRIEWRLFARYDAGAFDASEGLAHGWKTSPVLRLFGAEYLAPGVKLGSVER